MDNITNNNFTFLIKEYEKLKDEQHKRIEFRDHMIYLTIGAIGAVFSFALEKPDLSITYLVLPFLCIVLGWTYLGNDEKISSIGKYIRTGLIPKIEELHSHDKAKLTNNWEEFLRKDPSRKQRKRFQLFIDLCIFSLSGVVSIIAFFLLQDALHWQYFVIAIFEVALISYLSFQFIKYADINQK